MFKSLLGFILSRTICDDIEFTKLWSLLLLFLYFEYIPDPIIPANIIHPMLRLDLNRSEQF